MGHHVCSVFKNTFKAKSSLGFSPSTAIEDITEEKLHSKFVQKLQNVRVLFLINNAVRAVYDFLNKYFKADPENTRIIHEAYQFLTAKKKKKSGRSMTENWNKLGGKALVIGQPKL